MLVHITLDVPNADTTITPGNRVQLGRFDAQMGKEIK